MTAPALKPCPFCGRNPSFDDEAGVWCSGVGCSFDQTLSLAAWNTRPAPTPPSSDKERAVVEQIALRLDSDPHQWSKRPCETCREITKVAGRDFGCVAYAKSPLTYSSYGKQAEERLAALHPSQSAEKPAKEKA